MTRLSLRFLKNRLNRLSRSLLKFLKSLM